MKLFFVLVLLANLSCCLAQTDEASQLTFYLQLVRGSDSATPPSPEAKLVGPKLSERLHGIFKWTNYWEIKRDSVTVKTGEKVQKKMSAEREVEIELLNAHEMAVRTYCGGKPVSDNRESTENRFFIVGGDKAGGDSWFIVVRQSPPPDYKQ